MQSSSVSNGASDVTLEDLIVPLHAHRRTHERIRKTVAVRRVRALPAVERRIALYMR